MASFGGPMTRYAAIFILAYLAAALIGNAVAAALGGTGGGAVSLVSLILGVVAAASWFVKREQRVPQAHEKSQFAWQALVGMWVASLLAIVLFGMFAPSLESPKLLDVLSEGSFAMILLAVSVVFSLVSYFVIRWAFGWYAGVAHRR
jgi:hypothetical protein